MTAQPTVVLACSNAERREMTGVAGVPSVQSAIVAVRTYLDARALAGWDTLTELRFWSKIEKGPGCWLWRGSIGSKGYGYFHVGAKMRRAHRVSWEIASGYPGRLHVLHRCDNPPCVNPDHLFLGTNHDNVTDMVSKGRHPTGSGKPGAKLTEGKVAAIRMQLARGHSQASLARQFGVSCTVLNRIALGRTWRHVEAS